MSCSLLPLESILVAMREPKPHPPHVKGIGLGSSAGSRAYPRRSLANGHENQFAFRKLQAKRFSFRFASSTPRDTPLAYQRRLVREPWLFVFRKFLIVFAERLMLFILYVYTYTTQWLTEFEGEWLSELPLRSRVGAYPSAERSRGLARRTYWNEEAARSKPCAQRL